MIIIVDSDDKTNIRIDILLSQKLDLSRTYVSRLIDEGYVFVNDSELDKPSYKTKLNDKIEVLDREEEVLNVKPENIPLDIMYEDDDILIINKERGMVVHPSNGHLNSTLVNALMYHCKDKLSSINGVIRPGIVHRIDKDTSGLLCVCKNDFSHNAISNQFFLHTNIRKYKAIVKGNISDDEGVVDKPIGRDKKNRMRMSIVENGKSAKTYYKVLKRYNNFTYIECELFTGRTHQIRVHMKYLGHPLLGDLVYGNKSDKFDDVLGQVLHAYYLEFNHPRTNERMKFTSDLPEYFKNIIKRLVYE